MVAEIMDFCSEKNPDLQFDSDVVNELNAIINRIVSEEKLIETHGSMQEFATREAKEITELLLAGITQHVTQTAAQGLSNLLDPSAPYVAQHLVLTENIDKLVKHRDLEASQKLFFIKETLSEYVNNHHVQDSINLEHLTLEEIPLFMNAVLEARKNMFKKEKQDAQEALRNKQLLKENSIGEFNDKINIALKDNSYSIADAKKKDDFSKTLLQNECKRLLAVCLETNENLVALGLPNKEDNENNQTYCERAAATLRNEAHDPQGFADKLKQVNLNRKNDKQIVQFRQLGIFYSDYREKILVTASAVAGLAVCAGIYKVSKNKEDAIREMFFRLGGVASSTMQFAINRARDASDQVVSIAKAAVVAVVSEKIGKPLVKSMAQRAHQTVSYFFPKPDEENTSNSPDAVSPKETSPERKEKDTPISPRASFRKRSSSSQSPVVINDLGYQNDGGSPTPDSKQSESGRPSPSPSPSPVQGENETPKSTKFTK